VLGKGFHDKKLKRLTEIGIWHITDIATMGQ
jgi:hypothetical protein